MQLQVLPLWDASNMARIETYLLKDSREFQYQLKRPAVIVCPGGAYLGTSDREAEPVALRFNTMGHHAVVLRYNTFFYEFTDVFAELDSVAHNPNSQWPNPLLYLAHRQRSPCFCREFPRFCQETIPLQSLLRPAHLPGRTAWHGPGRCNDRQLSGNARSGCRGLDRSGQVLAALPISLIDPVTSDTRLDPHDCIYSSRRLPCKSMLTPSRKIRKSA